MKSAHILIALFVAVSLVAGCAAAPSGPREVKIVTTEMKFAPTVVQGKAGEKMKFVIENKGTVLHEFVSDDAMIQEVEVHPGDSIPVLVTLPATPGEYKFYCEAPGHHEAGMEGKIVVTK